MATMSAAQIAADTEFRAGVALLKSANPLPSAAHLKHEGCVLYFEKAGWSFVVARCWREAADAFMRASDSEVRDIVRSPARVLAALTQTMPSTVQSHCGRIKEAASFIVDAARCLRKIDINESIRIYLDARVLFCESGLFGRAAWVVVQIAELREEQRNWEDAVKYYQDASDYFLGDKRVNESNMCLNKVADIVTLHMKDYKRAYIIFRQQAKQHLVTNLTKLNAKTFYLKAGLCCMMYQEDLEDMDDKLFAFQKEDVTFVHTFENQFLEDTMDALEDRYGSP
jgi:tetratricopeptide (TPR) repeat protein